MTTRTRTKAEPEPADEPQAQQPAAESAPEPSGTEYLNTTNGPIRYDRDGRTVGGGEWTPPVNLDAIGQLARRRNYLVPRSAI